nr:MAG TPA: hypothetical protein [Bacteriophage sp.]
MSVVSYAIVLLVVEAVYVACSLALAWLKRKRKALEKCKDKR